LGQNLEGAARNITLATAIWRDGPIDQVRLHLADARSFLDAAESQALALALQRNEKSPVENAG